MKRVFLLLFVFFGFLHTFQDDGKARNQSTPDAVAKGEILSSCDNNKTANKFATTRCAHAGSYFNALDAGLDNTGTVPVQEKLQILINTAQTITGGSGIWFPCGTYYFTGGVVVSAQHVSLVGEQEGCVVFKRQFDYGPTVTFASVNAAISFNILANIEFYDYGAGLQPPVGYSTCKKSPYQIIYDGVYFGEIINIRIALGCGGIAIRGSQNIHVINVNVSMYQIEHSLSENSNGVGIFIGYSNNTHLDIPYSSGIFVDNTDVTAGASILTSKLAYGWQFDGVDGIFSTNCHAQFAGKADYLLGDGSGKYPVWNVYCSECMADITAGYGIEVSGVGIVSGLHWSGRISANGLNTLHPGIYVTGRGGLSNASFDIMVDGWGEGGFYSNAATFEDVTIRPRSFSNNQNGENAASDIDIQTGRFLSILGGTLDGSLSTSLGITVGSAVNNVAIEGVNVKRHSSYPMIVKSSASAVVVSGGDWSGNTGTGIVNNSAPSAVSVSGTFGVPWFTYDPKIGCGSGSVAALGSVVGSYNLNGNSLTIRATIPIIAIGSCAAALTVSLPAGLIVAEPSVIPGRDVLITGKALTAWSAAWGTTLQLQNFDNSFPATSGSILTIEGTLQIR